jgi:hypothetical protein
VTAHSDHVYEVEDTTTSVVTNVHSTRLRFYHDSSLEITAEIQAHLAHQKSSYEVSAFRDLRYDVDSKSYYVFVSWVGFEESDDTWEPLQIIYEDLPKYVVSFLHSFEDAVLAADARGSLLE